MTTTRSRVLSGAGALALLMVLVGDAVAAEPVLAALRNPVLIVVKNVARVAKCSFSWDRPARR